MKRRQVLQIAKDHSVAMHTRGMRVLHALINVIPALEQPTTARELKSRLATVAGIPRQQVQDVLLALMDSGLLEWEEWNGAMVFSRSSLRSRDPLLLERQWRAHGAGA